ncbi:MAG: Gfo/Idh/MocA family oxidoreductase [Pseudomonadota bacterium]
MGKIRTACIGTGYFSQFHYDAWNRIKEVELVASVSLDLEDARKTGLPAYDDTQTMLTEIKPSLVDIITPPTSHLSLIKMCVENGASTIICQKPFCNSIEEAREAVRIAGEAGVSLIVHENFRFQPWYRVMRKALEDKLIGEIHQLTFRLRTGDGQGPEAYLDRQPYFQKMEKFLIRETGVHWIDTFRYLLGNPVAVYADLRQLNPHISGEDAGYFILDFESGIRALFDANRHLDHEAENCRTTLGEAILEGTNGTINLSGRGEVTMRRFGSQDYESLLSPQAWKGFGGDCVHALQDHVVKAIQNKEPFENTAQEYLLVLELQAAIYHSAESGQKVFLNG